MNFSDRGLNEGSITRRKATKYETDGFQKTKKGLSRLRLIFGIHLRIIN